MKKKLLFVLLCGIFTWPAQAAGQGNAADIQVAQSGYVPGQAPQDGRSPAASADPAASGGVFTFDTLPSSAQEIREKTNFSNPKHTAAMFIVALKKYVENPEVGIEMINVLKGPQPLGNHDKSFLKDRFYDKKYLPDSYFRGATPENNYTPSQPYTLEFFDDKLPQNDENHIRVFIRSGGADSLHYVLLRRKQNEWFVWEYPGIVMSIRTPAAADPWK